MQGEEGYEAPVQLHEGTDGNLSRDLEEMKERMGELNVTEGKTHVYGQWADRKDANDGSFMVRLRGLPWETSEEAIKEFLKRVNVTPDSIFIGTNHKGRATGEAFVQLASEESRSAVQSLTGQNIGSRYIEVFTSSLKDREAAQSKAGRPVSGLDAAASLVPIDASMKLVRLRGLPFSATQQDVRAFFADLPIGNVHMISEMGWASGECFVEIPTAEGVEAALRHHKKNMGARYIEVFVSSPAELESRRNRVPPVAHVNPNAFVVRLRGLPFSATEAQVREFMQGILCGTVHMTTDYEGRPSGEAYVELPSEEAVSAALKLDRAEMGTRYIEVFRSHADEVWAALKRWGGPPHIYGAASPYGYGRSGMGYPEWHQFNRRRPGNYPTESHVLKMRGIPYSATDQHIHQFFLDARVHPLRIHRQYHGGEAYVEFASAQEAQQALTLHQCNMGPRYIELSVVPPEEVVAPQQLYVHLPQHHASQPHSFGFPYSEPRSRNPASYGGIPYGADARMFGSSREPYRPYGGSNQEYRR